MKYTLDISDGSWTTVNLHELSNRFGVELGDIVATALDRMHWIDEDRVAREAKLHMYTRKEFPDLPQVGVTIEAGPPETSSAKAQFFSRIDSVRHCLSDARELIRLGNDVTWDELCDGQYMLDGGGTVQFGHHNGVWFYARCARSWRRRFDGRGGRVSP